MCGKCIGYSIGGSAVRIKECIRRYSSSVYIIEVQYVYVVEAQEVV
jgi:hypothetical protein